MVITPPAVSIPRDNGATSNNNKESVLLDVSPVKIAACTAAPYATASSGLIDLHSSLPLNKSLINIWIRGIRVDPPTITISWISILSNLESKITFSTGLRHDLNKSSHSASNLALVILV